MVCTRRRLGGLAPTARRSVAAALACTLTAVAFTAPPAGGPAEAADGPEPRGIEHACPSEQTPAAGFDDIAGSVHEPGIDCVAWWAITRGVTDNAYAPAGPVSRDQMASFLARSVDATDYTLAQAGAQGFTDTAGNTHEASIDRLAADGVVQGVTETTYAPRSKVRRDQMASFLVRTYELVADDLPAGEAVFTDTAGNTHESNIDKAAAAGFAAGTGAGSYDPAAPVRRDQMATFLARMLDRLAEDGSLPADGPGISLSVCGGADFPCKWADADDEAFDRSIALLDRSVADLRHDTPADEVVAALRAEDDVARVVDDGAAITFRVHGGLPTVALTEDAFPGLEEAEASSQASQAEATPLSYDPAGTPAEQKRVLIVSPYDEAWANDATSSVESAFAARPDEYDLTVARGQQAGIRTMESVGSYDIVIVISHGSGGVAGRKAPDLLNARDKLPEGVVFSAGENDDPTTKRLYFGETFFEPLLNEDMIFFANWCDSASKKVARSTGATILGWTDYIQISFARDAVATYWQLMVQHGVEAGLAHSMLAARDLTVEPPDQTPAKLAFFAGGDRRARDVVTASVDSRPLREGMDLEWDGVPGDGTLDVLTDLSFLVEGVEGGREAEPGFRLFLRGEGVPEEEIPVDLSLLGDGEIATAGEGHNDWLVTADEIDLPYDVSEEMTAPTALEFEVRVGESDERYSAQRVVNVRLPVAEIHAVHPAFLSELRDGDRHPAEGIEGDGAADDTTVVLEVTDVDSEDVADFHVEAEVTAETLDGPVEIDEPLAAFDQLDERTYRYSQDIALDHDLRSTSREMTIDPTLRKDGETFSTHMVTVDLHAQAPSDCWIERTYSGTWEDPDNGTLVPISGSGRWDPAASAGGIFYDDEREHLRHLALGHEGTGLFLLDIVDQTGAIPLGETGTFQVPYEPNPDGYPIEQQRMYASVGDSDAGDEYEGPGTLVVTATDFGPDVFGNDQVHMMEADFSATLDQIGEFQDRRLRGQIDIQGSFLYTLDEGCNPFDFEEE